MQRKSVSGIVVSVVVLTVVAWLWNSRHSSPHSITLAKISQSDLHDLRLPSACRNELLKEEYGNGKSVAVIYDYSSITAEQLRDDISLLVSTLTQELVAEYLLVENKCELADTSAAAVNTAKQHPNMRVVVVEADERVSTGRARIAAVEKTTAPFILFLSAGNMPNSTSFLEQMLYMAKDSPEKVVVASRKHIFNGYQHITWSLKLKRSRLPDFIKQIRPTQLPLVDNSAFLIRSDMYKAIGGYDSYFFKNDASYAIAFSLAVWLCGGTIVRSECAHVSGSTDQDSEKQVLYLQHAKYLQQVFGGSLTQQFTYPGIEFYKPSGYDQHAITSRKAVFADKGCMTMEWYAHKFNSVLPVQASTAKLYNPNYKPLLPVFEKLSPHIGRWLVLLAGQCVHVSKDLVLGLSWCPTTLAEDYTFLWQDNGQIRAKGNKCVTVQAPQSYLVVAECKDTIDASQQFVFNKSKRQILTADNKQCLTHMNGENNRQILQPRDCDENSPFTKFVINDDY